MIGQKDYSKLWTPPRWEKSSGKKFMQNWGPRITAIPVICTEGIIDIGMYAGNVNAGTFLNFVTDKLCPYLLPFNGRNLQSVVILRNGSL